MERWLDGWMDGWMRGQLDRGVGVVMDGGVVGGMDVD